MSDPLESDKLPLFPYQVIGAEFLAARQYALLADEMGLGKSAQAIRAAELIGARSVLVVCPASVCFNWRNEWPRFGTVPEVLEVRSYDSVTRSPPTQAFDVAIYDEAHYLKNPDAQRTLICMTRVQGQRLWWLSGTPAPNHAGELWTYMRRAGRTTLHQSQWEERYCKQRAMRVTFEKFGRKQTKTVNTIEGTNEQRIPELRKLLDGFMLRRQKTEVMGDLPKLTHHQLKVPGKDIPIKDYSLFLFDRWLQCDQDDAKLAAHVQKEMAALQAVLDLSQSSQREQTDTGPTFIGSQILHGIGANGTASAARRVLAMEKAYALAEMVYDEILVGAYEKIVIFCYHQCVINVFQDRLRKWGLVSIFGKTPIDKREKHVHDFQNNPRCKVFIGQIQAAGTGINLTAANHVLMAEPSYVPGENAQAVMRCHRIGQTKPVTVRWAVGSKLDEKIIGIVRRKTQDLVAIYGDDVRKNNTVAIPKDDTLVLPNIPK